MDSNTILCANAASVVLVVGTFWLIRRRIGGRAAPRDESKVPARPDRPGLAGNSDAHEHRSAETAGGPQIPGPEESSPAVERLAAVKLRIADSDLREFMEDIIVRVREASPDFGKETPLGFIEETVDRMDDLRAILKNHQGQAAKDVEMFRKTLAEVLSDCAVELIHSDQWDPTTQRAIAKEPAPGIESPSILRFGSTGIRRNGQLVRKQEVVLGVPL